MSWDASLMVRHAAPTCPHCGGDTGPIPEPTEAGWWNYTHNTNKMIRAAADPDWWDSLEGKPVAEGVELLGRIIKGLEADSDQFRAMNPPNGWGDYDGLLAVLRDMHQAGTEEIGTERESRVYWNVSG